MASSTPIDGVLARLTGIRAAGGSQWYARCPGPLHRHGDRHQSLSIRERRDGAVLLHCHAGCSTSDVLAAIAMDFRDLFPPREPASPSSRCRPWAARFSAADLLEIVSEEVTVAADVAAYLRAGKTISEEDWQRLAAAVGRIQRVRDYIARAA